MQKSMKANIGTPTATGVLEAVAVGVDNAAAMSPAPAWADWATSSKGGAAAARRGDVAATKASCTSCHAKYKET